MRHEQIIDTNKSYPVFQFCKKNKIDCTWDFSRKDSTAWTEVLVDGNLVMQIEHTATVDQFKTAIKILSKDFKAKNFTKIPGDDFWFAMGTKENFDKFVDKHNGILS